MGDVTRCNECGGWKYADPYDDPETGAVAAGKTPALLAVGSSEWVDALAERWERRLKAMRVVAWNALGQGQMSELQKCLDDLRAESESASTDGMSDR